MTNIIENIKKILQPKNYRISFSEGTRVSSNGSRRLTASDETFAVRSAEWSDGITTARTVGGGHLKALNEPISCEKNK